MKTSISRLDALKEFSSEWHGSRLVEKLTEAEFDEIVAFIEDNDELDHLAFEYLVNRMHLNRQKPKNWAVVQEILCSINTRAKGKTKE